ncbi:MAG: 20S proteasome subunit A/B [Wenzhouxiangella sp.]|nr:MAG: 20S proteasome subunit A/B [Wenzhouxiangella sp.]
MTYCLGLRLNAGLVLASDSRTSASLDDISVYSKMHVFQTAPDRVVVLLSSGNLATSQAVRSQINRDLGNPQATRNLDTLEHLDEIAAYVGEINRQIQQTVAPAADQASGFNPEATFLLGGQVGTGPHDIFLIYPQGNYIAASRQKPFLQIGETKYGKPILSRLANAGLSLDLGARLALVSMDAAMRSNLSVGPPLEVAVCPAGRHALERRLKLEGDDPYLKELGETWNEKLGQAFLELPDPQGWQRG